MARDTLFLLIAIILAIPLSVIANLLTPRLRDWWSHRSKNRLRNRIAELEAELKASTYTFEEVVLEIALGLAWGLTFLTIQITLSAVFPVIFGTEGLRTSVQRIAVLAVIILIYGVIVFQLVKAATAAGNYLKRWPNSDPQRKIRKRIDRLKEVLSRKQ